MFSWSTIDMPAMTPLRVIMCLAISLLWLLHVVQHGPLPAELRGMSLQDLDELTDVSWTVSSFSFQSFFPFCIFSISKEIPLKGYRVESSTILVWPWTFFSWSIAFFITWDWIAEALDACLEAVRLAHRGVVDNTLGALCEEDDVVGTEVSAHPAVRRFKYGPCAAHMLPQADHFINS